MKYEIIVGNFNLCEKANHYFCKENSWTSSSKGMENFINYYRKLIFLPDTVAEWSKGSEKCPVCGERWDIGFYHLPLIKDEENQYQASLYYSFIHLIRHHKILPPLTFFMAFRDKKYKRMLDFCTSLNKEGTKLFVI